MDEFAMVGILCRRRKERLFTQYLRSNKNLKDRRVAVLVFSMPNINLNDKTVYGTLIYEGAAKAAKAELPSLIFNFAVQHSKSHIKKLKELMEIENISVINTVNSFNQQSIMEMLSSDNNTKKYLLPFEEVSLENTIPDFHPSNGFILKPRNGAALAKTIYCKKSDYGYDLYNISEIAYSHLFDIQSAVIPVIRSGKWILLRTPKLVTYNNRLMIIRSYLQKSGNGEWKVLLKKTAARTGPVYKKDDEKIDAVLLQMMNYIHCFIPDLAFCSIDFVLNTDGKPYFLSLGGWQDLTMTKKQRHVLLASLCDSILAVKNLELVKVINYVG